MKTTLLAAAFLTFWSLTAEAKGYYYRHHIYHHTNHYGRYLAHRHWRHLNQRWAHRIKHIGHWHTASASTGSSAPCHNRAAFLGGPCGCESAWRILRIADQMWRGHNLWLAWDWSSFPRAEPGPGTAAVWKNHSHVAAVKYARKDGTVVVDDYWGAHPVSRSAVIIVDPHPPIKTGWRVAEAWPL